MNNKDGSIKKTSLLITAFIFICLIWTILFISLSIRIGIKERSKFTSLILIEARSFFDQLVATREWNTKHGGVYVPVTHKTQPYPYPDVPRCDIVTIYGLQLTFINPAYMTRQIADTQEQMQFHITSLNPIRPKNAPLEWESEALRGFSEKTDEYYDWSIPPRPGNHIWFRFMAPLVTEKSCLQCHAQQGYEVGDIRGGISISIPADKNVNVMSEHIKWQTIVYIVVWILGILGVVVTFRMLGKEYKERSHLIVQLQTTIKEMKTLKGFISICASCKKVRNDAGYWDQIEQYIKNHSDIEFSHGICPDCVKELYPEVVENNKI